MYARDMAPRNSLVRLKEEALAGDAESTVNVPLSQQSQLPRALMLCMGLCACTPFT
jgi:hypothetical protein